MKISERILYICEGYLAITKINSDKQKKNPAALELKKLVVTTQKIYIFKTLDHEITEQERKKSKNSINLKPIQRDYTSITGDPESELEIRSKQPKIITETESPLIEVIKKITILDKKLSFKNSVFLFQNDIKSMEVVLFQDKTHTKIFSNAIECANAWMKYLEHCKQHKVNYKWIDLMKKFIENIQSAIVVDPNDFNQQNQQEQFKAFTILVEKFSYLYRAQLRFKIHTNYGIVCANKFLSSKKFTQIKILDLPKCGMTDFSLSEIEKSLVNLFLLQQLNLQENNLSDQSMLIFINLLNKCFELKNFKLSNNYFQLKKSENSLDNILKSTKQLLKIDLSQNKIGDESLTLLQKSILYAKNPPLLEINLNNNEFTKFGIWRLHIGNIKTKKNHQQLKLIIFPVPFHSQIFAEEKIEFQVQRKKNQNFPESNALQGIKMRRKNNLDKPLPANKKEISGLSSMKMRLAMLIEDEYTPIQQIFKICQEISSKPYGFPSSILQQITLIIFKKLDEVLFIRDHYSIQILKDSAKLIDVDLSTQKQKLDKVEKRKQKFNEKIKKLINFQIEQSEINREFENVIKQAIKLSFQGPAMNLLLFLKNRRDQKIYEYVFNKYNPLSQIEELKIRDAGFEIQLTKIITETPEIFKNNEINQNWWKHYLQANYSILSAIEQKQLDQSISIIKSMKATNNNEQKLLNLCKDRINFIKNQFYNNFILNYFKISFIQLKINSARLLWLYKNLKITRRFKDIPIYSRKKPIIIEKYIKLPIKKQDFLNQFSIETYSNLKKEALDYGVYNWKNIFVKYDNIEFVKQAIRICEYINQFLQIICTFNINISEEIVKSIIQILKFIRSSKFPQQILEQFYLHIILFQQVKNKALEFLIQIIPFLTFYMRPPIIIQNYLLAFLAKHDCNFTYIPLSLQLKYTQNQEEYQDRDWIPKQKHILSLIQTYGKIPITVYLFMKIPFQITVKQSITVANLMEMLLQHEILASFIDRFSLWIYKYNKTTDIEIALQNQQYIGEIIANLSDEDQILYIRRRIYSPYYKVNFSKYSKEIINSLYLETKQHYLRGTVYKCSGSQIQLASIIAFVNIYDTQVKKISSTLSNEFKVYITNLDKYYNQLFPRNFYTEKSKKEILKNLSIKLNERLVKQQEKNILKLKHYFLSKFRNKQFYCSNNYILKTIENIDCILSINTLFLCILTEQSKEYIYLENLVKMIPKQTTLTLVYYNRETCENVETVFQTTENQCLQIMIDTLNYCSLRLKIPSNYLYLFRQLNLQLHKYDITLDFLDTKTNNSIQTVIKKIHKHDGDVTQKMIIQYMKKIQTLLIKIEEVAYSFQYQKIGICYQSNIFIGSLENRQLYLYKSQQKLPGKFKQFKQKQKNKRLSIKIEKQEEISNVVQQSKQIDPLKEEPEVEIKVVKPRASGKGIDRSSRRRQK